MLIPIIADNNYYTTFLDAESYQLYLNAVNGLSHGDLVASVRMDYNEETFNQQMMNVVQAIICGHPEFFYISPRAEISYSDGHASIRFDTLYDLKDVDEFNELVINKIDEIAKALSEYTNQLDLIYHLNDYLCLNFEGENAFSKDNGNAYGVLTGKKARCEGFCKVAKLVLSRVGIESIICTGKVDYEGELFPHAWLAINYNGQYYAFDFSYNYSNSVPKCPCRAYTFLNQEIIESIRKADYVYPITTDESMLFWKQHNGEMEDFRDLANADVNECDSIFYTIHHLNMDVEIGEYEKQYEMRNWIQTFMSPYVYGYSFVFRYMEDIKVLEVYYIND